MILKSKLIELITAAEYRSAVLAFAGGGGLDDKIERVNDSADALSTVLAEARALMERK